MSGSWTEEKREEAKRWRFQQNAGSAATSAAGAVIRAVLPATSARMKKEWKHGLRTLPAAVKTSVKIIAAAVKTGAAAAGITADAKTDAVAGITAAVRTAAAVVNVMHGIS